MHCHTLCISVLSFAVLTHKNVDVFSQIRDLPISRTRSLATRLVIVAALKVECFQKRSAKITCFQKRYCNYLKFMNILIAFGYCRHINIDSFCKVPWSHVSCIDPHVVFLHVLRWSNDTWDLKRFDGRGWYQSSGSWNPSLSLQALEEGRLPDFCFGFHSRTCFTHFFLKIIFCSLYI